MFENTADFVESVNLVCFPYRELANVNQRINFSLEKIMLHCYRGFQFFYLALYNLLVLNSTF